jgi:TonB family protein
MPLITLRRVVAGVFLSLPTIALGQVIGGRVLERTTQHPIAAITVYALHDTAVVSRSSTDTAGIFYLTLPHPGVYRLRFGEPSADPFMSDTLSVGDQDFLQRTFTIDLGTDRVYREIEVARPVQPGANRPAPYPEELRKEGAQGEVLVQFVVDTTGRVVENSLKILRATDFRFVPTVRDAVLDYVFRPALLSNGKKVRQMVQMPFQFQLR